MQKLTVTYKVMWIAAEHDANDTQEKIRGPLKTATDAANAQLQAEGQEIRLQLASIVVEGRGGLNA